MPNHPSLLRLFQDNDKEQDNEILLSDEEQIIEEQVANETHIYINPRTAYVSHPLDHSVVNTDHSSISPAGLRYMSDSNAQKFFLQQHKSPHGGIRGLVKRADTRDMYTHEICTTDEADLLFNFNDNLIQMTRAEQDCFLLSHSKHSEAFHPALPAYNTEIPLDRASAERICLRSETFIYNLIPSERVFSLENDGHSMISLSC